MLNLSEIILFHFEKYPNMQIQDVFKLIYQNEFGCGHLLKNENAALEYLENEYNLVPKQKRQLYTNIGNGFIRVDLNTFKYNETPLIFLSEAFIKTAKQPFGNIDSFYKKLNEFKAMCQQQLLPFNSQNVDEFIHNWHQNNMPIVSHTNTYRQDYTPAYRVVHEKYLK